MAANNRDIPKLSEGDLFTAVLPSREGLIKGLRDDYHPKLRQLIKRLEEDPYSTRYATPSLHRGVLDYAGDGREGPRPVYELTYDYFSYVFIRPDLLKHDTRLLCLMKSLDNNYCEVIHITDNPIVKKEDPVTLYIGFMGPYLPIPILQDITVIKKKNDIII